MKSDLEKLIEQLEYENLNILQVSELLDDKFELSNISRTMMKIRKRKEIFPPNVFGKCGIDSRANPCGDASEY